MGVLPRGANRVRHADCLKYLQHPFALLALVGALLMPMDGLGDLVADGEDGIQGARRLLKYHGDASAPQLAHLLFGQGEDVRPAKVNSAALYTPGMGDQSQNTASRHGLAATGLADDPNHLSMAHPEIDPVESVNHASFGEKLEPQIFDTEKLLAHLTISCKRGSKMSRSESPSRLKASETMSSVTAGKIRT